MTAEPTLDWHARLSCAPMMDWTDRHCRAVHRTLSRHTLLYTEMVTAAALIRGGARHLLAFGDAEHPVAVQLGGADPAELAAAARLAEDEGYDEVNLNVGCPSDRVQSGAFGAILMERPALVAECVAEMAAATRVPVTVKCRIGVDEQDPAQSLPDFLTHLRAAGARRVIVHARKAWLKGLSPKENREVPPLDYPLVHAMKRAFPDLHLSINGGLGSLDAALAELAPGPDGIALDGAMIGRAAYQRPAEILLRADSRVFGRPDPLTDPAEAVAALRPYIAEQLARGVRLHAITRHMLGLFSGRPGARHWRRTLSEGATRAGAGLDLVDAALSEVQGHAHAAE
ncbi:MAG: tRNA dihydrouridine(20/20a) synthase DusA [Pseudomonadota bacterium]